MKPCLLTAEPGRYEAWAMTDQDRRYFWIYSRFQQKNSYKEVRDEEDRSLKLCLGRTAIPLGLLNYEALCIDELP